MSDFHNKIKQTKKLLDRVELMVIRNPNNILYKQLLNTVLVKYKKALKGEL